MQQLQPLQQLTLSQLTQHQQNNQSIIEEADHWSAFFTPASSTKSQKTDQGSQSPMTSDQATVIQSKPCA
jgi:hypothetical protein